LGVSQILLATQQEAATISFVGSDFLTRTAPLQPLNEKQAGLEVPPAA
jgi:hypothetical protein